MSTTDSPDSAPKKRWLTPRRVAFVLVILAALTGARAWLVSSKTRGIQAQIDAIRAAGQPSTPAELDAWYPAVPPERNAALLVLNALDGARETDSSRLPHLGDPWTPEHLAWAEVQRPRVAGIRSNLAVALRLTEARYPLNLTQSITTLPLRHLAPVKGGATTLGFWARHSAWTGKPDEAVDALLDGIRLARTLDREPLLISELVRVACLSIVSRAAEDALTATPLPPARLAELQTAFSSAAEHNGMIRALAGERVFTSEVFRLSPSQIAQLNAGVPATPSNGAQTLQTLTATAYRLSGAEQSDHQFYLETMREFLRCASLDGKERLRATEELQTNFMEGSKRWNRMRSRAFVPALFNVVAKAARNQATLRCTVAALAVERYRADHNGALPANLDALVPNYLPAVPLDPMDDKPLKFRPLEKGFVVYSIGEDNADNNGTPFTPGKSKGGSGSDYTFTVGR